MATAREAVLDTLARGGADAKIRAIKVYREMTGTPLAVAKEAVEEIMADPRERVRVRIAVAVDASGKWYGCGSSGGDAAEDMDFTLDCVGEHNARYWFTAELPIPTVREIEASVEVDDGE